MNNWQITIKNCNRPSWCVSSHHISCPLALCIRRCPINDMSSYQYKTAHWTLYFSERWNQSVCIFSWQIIVLLINDCKIHIGCPHLLHQKILVAIEVMNNLSSGAPSVNHLYRWKACNVAMVVVKNYQKSQEQHHCFIRWSWPTLLANT
jgi:hypothetical protein